MTLFTSQIQSGNKPQLYGPLFKSLNRSLVILCFCFFLLSANFLFTSSLESGTSSEYNAMLRESQILPEDLMVRHSLLDLPLSTSETLLSKYPGRGRHCSDNRRVLK